MHKSILCLHLNSIFRDTRGELNMPSNQPFVEPRQPRTASEGKTPVSTLTMNDISATNKCHTITRINEQQLGSHSVLPY